MSSAWPQPALHHRGERSQPELRRDAESGSQEAARLLQPGHTRTVLTNALADLGGVEWGPYKLSPRCSTPGGRAQASTAAAHNHSSSMCRQGPGCLGARESRLGQEMGTGRMKRGQPGGRVLGGWARVTNWRWRPHKDRRRLQRDCATTRWGGRRPKGQRPGAPWQAHAFHAGPGAHGRPCGDPSAPRPRGKDQVRPTLCGLCTGVHAHTVGLQVAGPSQPPSASCTYCFLLTRRPGPKQPEGVAQAQLHVPGGARCKGRDRAANPTAAGPWEAWARRRAHSHGGQNRH